jgi:hypothetical protein
MGYEAMLHGELSSYIGEIGDERKFLSETEAWFQNFPMEYESLRLEEAIYGKYRAT